MTDFSRKKVLLVDDEETLLLTMTRYIKNAGFDVETASDGKEAVEKVKAGQPDLVVMDAMMPIMNGFQATREISDLKLEKKIPIIMLTALKAEADVVDARDSGVIEFLRKPIKGEDLVRYILKHLHSPLKS